MQATLGDALSKLDELKRADKAEIPAGFDMEAVQGQAKVHMNEGHYATAQQEAEAAVATLAAMLERIREQEIERTKFLAAQVKTLRRVVDPAATHPAVATELSVGRRAEVRAQQAEQQSDYHEAAAAYEAARAAYQAVAERLTEEQERELAGARAHVQQLLKEADGAPAEIVGQASEAAQVALTSARGPGGESLAVLNKAEADLAAALAQTVLFGEASERRATAERVQRRAAALPMVAVEVEPAEQVIQAAAAEFDAGRWAEARDRYAEAAQLWTSLERNALERDAVAKEEAQERRRQALEAEVQQQLAALEHLEEEFEALGIPPGTGQKRGTLQAGLDAVAQLEQTEGRDEALDQLETLREQVVSALQETKASLQDWLQRDLAALGESWRELAGRAGAFLPQQQAEQFEQQLSSVRRAVTDQQWESARSGLREGRALLQQAEQVARSEVERTVQATFGEVVEALKRAFDRRQWAEAREQYAEAAEAWGPLIHEGEARARADSERGQQLEAARQRLRVLVEQAGEAPAEVVGDVLAKAEQMLATQKPVIEAMQEAEVQLTATLAEVPLFSTAAERRNAAQEQERRTLALQPRRRQLGAARKLMREAEAAFTQHNWDLVQQRYPAAADAFASLEHILVEQPTQVTTRDEERPRTTRRLAAIAAGLLLVAGSVDVGRPASAPGSVPGRTRWRRPAKRRDPTGPESVSPFGAG